MGDGNVVRLEAPSFYLPDQVSQFRVDVDLITSEGRMAFSQKTLTSALPLYAKFNLPQALMIGDKLQIPFTINSALDKAMDFEYLILERELTSEGKLKILHY